MGKISAVEIAMLKQLTDCGLSALGTVLDKSYGYLPTLRKLPAVSVSTVKGKFQRITSREYKLKIFPALSIVSTNLRDDKDKRHANADLLETIAAVLIGRTFSGICEPLEPSDFDDELGITNIEAGEIYYRLSFETAVTLDLIDDTDSSLALTTIINTFRMKPENFDALTSTVNL